MAGFSFQDIAAISKILGSKPFFFGDEMTAIDCTIFGHLAQFLFIPMDFPQKKFITEDCPVSNQWFYFIGYLFWQNHCNEFKK